MGSPGAGNARGIDEDTAPRFAAIAGEVLRSVRMGRSLSLRQVTVRSHGRFKPSSVASYERGERQVSLERLFALADVYDVAPERIVAAIAHRLERLREGESERNEGVVVMDTFALGPPSAR